MLKELNNLQIQSQTQLGQHNQTMQKMRDRLNQQHWQAPDVEDKDMLVLQQVAQQQVVA